MFTVDQIQEVGYFTATLPFQWLKPDISTEEVLCDRVSFCGLHVLLLHFDYDVFIACHVLFLHLICM